MVIDCGRSNCYFDQPADVSLCSGDALGRIELEADEELFITSADLKDAFYHLLLPEKLRKYFGSRCVSARDLGITCINGNSIPPHTLLRPRLAVVPTGWSWALLLCQSLHEKIIADAGAPVDSKLADHFPAPSTQCFHTEYVDNYFVLDTDLQRVQALTKLGVDALKARGLEVHEEQVSGDQHEMLGWLFESPCTLRPTRVPVAPRRLLQMQGPQSTPS